MDRAARVLFVLAQLPEDPGSRIPWAALRAAETLRLAGCDCRVLAVTAVVRPLRTTAFRLLEQTGFAPRVLPAKSGGRVRPELQYKHGEIPCRVVDTGNYPMDGWEGPHGRAFDLAFGDELRHFQPDILVVSASGDTSRRRHSLARNAGIRVVLALQRLQPAPDTQDLYAATYCHSEWLAARYVESTNFRPTVLPPAVPPAEVAPETHEPLCTTFIQPAREHGLYLLLRLAEQLSLARPGDPILVLSSATASATGQGFIASGRAAGFDLGQYDNIMIAEPALNPRDTWAGARVFVAPTLANPPAALIAEALVNGIPPLVGDRIGMADLLRGAGRVLAMPLDFDERARSPLPVAALEPWVEMIQQLCDDEAFYAAESEKARIAGRAFFPAALAPQYAAFIASVLEVS